MIPVRKVILVYREARAIPAHREIKAIQVPKGIKAIQAMMVPRDRRV